MLSSFASGLSESAESRSKLFLPRPHEQIHRFFSGVPRKDSASFLHETREARLPILIPCRPIRPRYSLSAKCRPSRFQRRRSKDWPPKPWPQPRLQRQLTTPTALLVTPRQAVVRLQAACPLQQMPPPASRQTRPQLAQHLRGGTTLRQWPRQRQRRRRSTHFWQTPSLARICIGD